MVKKVIVCIFLMGFLSIHTLAQTHRQIEIFDIAKGKVVMTSQPNPKVNLEVGKYLAGISSVYPKLNPVPREGFMIKVPLEPSVRVKTQLFTGPVEEVIIIFPAYENPHLMFFDDRGRALVFNFKGDAAKLLELLNFKP
ncbi:hypothetical protein DRW41_08590 [Neobacillus piezotolerans]|uniref:Group-specific protein n=1 Tax=Neobacillus piezotolerans TaxID=2259171 RepID=A0A3D8GTR6_9BACI|nr:hypothetical protein [Neobacillus piezotolerans]RDU37864.1 hypothetical protein DRW41_08590 [Neobacillus piezotolerans]